MLQPNHFGLSSDPDGCKPCDCAVGGALDNECDVLTGQCKCREHYSGRTCNTTESSFYCPALDEHTYEAETAFEITSGDVISRGAEGRPRTWTGQGFVRVIEGTNITFIVDNVLRSGQYNLVLRYEIPSDGAGWDDIKITLVRPGDPSLDGPCANIVASEDFLIARLNPHQTFSEVFPAVCLETGVRYELHVYFGERRAGYPDISAQALMDSVVLVPPTDTLAIFKGSQQAQYDGQIYER